MCQHNTTNENLQKRTKTIKQFMLNRSFGGESQSAFVVGRTDRHLRRQTHRRAQIKSRCWVCLISVLCILLLRCDDFGYSPSNQSLNNKRSAVESRCFALVGQRSTLHLQESSPGLFFFLPLCNFCVLFILLFELFVQIVDRPIVPWIGSMFLLLKMNAEMVMEWVRGLHRILTASGVDVTLPGQANKQTQTHNTTRTNTTNSPDPKRCCR